jgi:hypothetical protein
MENSKSDTKSKSSKSSCLPFISQCDYSHRCLDDEEIADEFNELLEQVISEEELKDKIGRNKLMCRQGF